MDPKAGREWQPTPFYSPEDMSTCHCGIARSCVDPFALGLARGDRKDRWCRTPTTKEHPTSGQSISRKRGNGRVPTPTAAGRSLTSRHRKHGPPSSRIRSRACTSRTPAARSEPTQQQQTKIFSVRSTQYAVGVLLIRLYLAIVGMGTVSRGRCSGMGPYSQSKSRRSASRRPSDSCNRIGWHSCTHWRRTAL